MTETLISFSTAKLAKEKGYNQNPYRTPNAYGPEFVDGSNVRLRSSSLFNPESNTAVAPTQSLLQKWLREVHDIHISIIYCGNCGKNQYTGTTMYGLHETHNHSDEYENCLEYCLIEALKLIS